MARKRTYHGFSVVAGSALLLLGVLVLVGWEYGLPVLKAIRPGLPSMKPNGAIAFAALGISLLLYCASSRVGWLRWLGALVSVGVLVLAGVTISQDIGRLDLGIDTILYSEAPNIHSLEAGRMSLNAGIAFVLASIALALLNLRRLPIVVEGLAVLAGFIGLLGVLGYLYNVESLYGFGQFSRMSAHGALGFMLLCIGILTARVDRGPMALVMSETAAGLIMRRLLPIAVVLPIATGFIRLLGEREGLYNTEYGLALHVTSVIIVLVGLIWWNAISVFRAELGRRRAENEIVRLNRNLKRRVAELQTVFEVAPVGLAVAHDDNCEEISANPTFARMLGVDPGVNVSKTGENAASLPFRVRSNGEEVPPDSLTMQVATRTRHLVAGREAQIEREDGDIVTLLEYAAPLFDEDGNVRGALGAFVDITNLKRTEASLEEKTRTLETINRVNTQLAAELDIEQLAQTLTDAGSN